MIGNYLLSCTGYSVVAPSYLDEAASPPRFWWDRVWHSLSRERPGGYQGFQVLARFTRFLNPIWFFIKGEKWRLTFDNYPVVWQRTQLCNSWFHEVSSKGGDNPPCRGRIRFTKSTNSDLSQKAEKLRLNLIIYSS